LLGSVKPLVTPITFLGFYTLSDSAEV